MPPTSARISLAECPVSHLQGEAQLRSACPAGAPRLVNGFPTPIVHELFDLVFLSWILGQVNLFTSPLRTGFPFPMVLLFSWICFLLVSKARCYDVFFILCRI